MLDSVADPKNDTLTELEKEALNKLNKAQEGFDKATEDYGRAAYEYGVEIGWELGFNQGLEAAWDAIRQQEGTLKTKVKTGKIERPRVPSTATSAALARPPVGRRRGTLSSDVLIYIRLHPGARGVDIAKVFAASSVPERTIRTVLHRLKKAGRIKISYGQWYATEEKR